MSVFARIFALSHLPRSVRSSLEEVEAAPSNKKHPVEAAPAAEAIRPLHHTASHEVLGVVGGEDSSFLGVESKALQSLAPGAIHFAMQHRHVAGPLVNLTG